MTGKEIHDTIHRLATECGAARCGVTRVEPVDPDAQAVYDSWIARGCNATMHYLGNHRDLRVNPATLLEGAQTLIVCAFPYHTGSTPQNPSLKIADYALGLDYHKVLRRRLKKLANELTTMFGGNTRICVDTAPLRERYWAARAGLGFIGVNNHLIIPDLGSNFFLGEVLWTGTTDTDPPLDERTCSRCMKCVKNCPCGAIAPDGSIDARRCLSYLTIEHRGVLPEDIDLHGCFYGCDICRKICPHNPDTPVAALPEFIPHPEIISLSPNDILSMTQTDYDRIFQHSAMRRSPLADMQQRANILIQNKNATKNFD